jgi:hypothetical protein
MEIADGLPVGRARRTTDCRPQSERSKRSVLFQQSSTGGGRTRVRRFVSIGNQMPIQ